MSDASRNRQIIERFWHDLFRHDFEAVGAYFSPDGHYTDMPTGDDGARGPEQVAARLRRGFEKVQAHHHHIRHIVAEGSIVMTEHAETWVWDDEHSVTLPFVSVHEIHHELITRWWDYWDLPTLMNAAPQWWLDDLAAAG